MNPITCGMAADLLPLYLDGCCSADSCAALEAHMDACPAAGRNMRSCGAA